MRRLERSLITAIAAISLLIPVASASPAHQRLHRAAATTTRTALPLIDVDGYQHALAKYKGKPTMVTFWATWCEPCRYEFPMIVQLTHQYAPKGLAVFGVNLDDDADMHLVRDFLAKNQPPFPSYRQKPGIDVDAFYHGVNPSWTGTMPQTIFYDRDGRMAGYFFGGQSREMFEKAIQMVLASPPPAAGSR